MDSPFVALYVLPAVIGWLTADSALADVLSTSPSGGPAIYNDVPTGATYPYLVVGDATEIPFYTLGGKTGSWGGRVTLSIRAVSRYRGDKEANEIVNAVKRCLDDAPLVVSGFPSVFVQFESANFYQEVAGGVTTRFGASLYSVTAHESD
jgi:hypothetical protein